MKSRLTQHYKSLKRIELQLSCQLILWTLVVLSVVACSRRYHEMPAYLPFPVREYPNYSVGRFKSSYLADQIDQFYRGTNPGPIGVTTFVNLDDLYTTSTFGRMYAEQLMSELTMRNFDVIELRHSDALQFLQADGEFALSRDVAVVRRQRDLGGIVVGTYVVSPIRVYVNARLLDPSTSMLLSAASVEMDKSDEIARLLRGGSFPGTLERIPVRHLGLSTFPMNVMSPYYQSHTAWEEGGAGAATPEFYSSGAGATRSARTPTWKPGGPDWKPTLPEPKK